MTTISLVLGSGGARGMAHIGVIRELESSGYRIASVTGCSIGAVIGGVYARGKLDAFADWVCQLSSSDMMSMLDPTLQKGGLIKGEGIIEALTELVGDQAIEELPLPYTALAADVSNEKEVWLNTGSLMVAIRASMSLPLFFTPVPYNGSYLIDGGVLNPVPIAPTFSDNSDLTLAVNLGGAMFHRAEPALSQATEQEQESSLYRKVTHYVDKLLDQISENEQTDWGMYQVADQAFDAMQSTIARQKLAAYPPDITVEIPRNACGTFDFYRAGELIKLGEEKTREAIDNWR